ncbi:peptide chain release factor N(5)-glutamine methyltransferase [Parasphingorhabdus halotolerans]|uniref:Release factor glutamine methyltransferase n=1 Tax=Parasphingorhabdus halotolerans TaxID=2725558 RepID=A0A6H2DNN0_9SPHN|nr:peptide chain release factor N(5)-glutamine methyltransferase [Parasphingorhabdus halotolerans]QJB69798.1 peptide chain release factor N(5)-glutamine methyltransferase [Parasphingorhabdus halotolerans]
MGEAALALRDAARRLEPVSDTPRLDAELLMAHALGIEREQLLLDLPRLTVPESFGDLLERRAKHEPIAHITGTREFWGLELLVSPDVLIPRPDSETLIEQAVEIFQNSPPHNILDLGTGSGALLLAALHEFHDAKGVGIDSSAAALQIAHNNADRLDMSDRAWFALLDWTRPDWIDRLDGPFDLILANPPYVSSSLVLAPEVAGFEPHQALFAGEEGLDDYRVIIPALDRLLADKGVALLEIGFDQAASVSEIASGNGYVIECKQDLGGNDRLLTLRRQK